MSLQAWYPFNGNYENQGLGDLDLIVTTSPSYTTGKVTNQGLNLGGFTWTATQSAKVLNNKALSICFWLKPTTSASAGGGSLFGQHSPNRRFCIFTYPNLNDLHLDWRYDDSGTMFCGFVESGFFTVNQWTHCAITFEAPNILKIYKNGSLFKTYIGQGTMNISNYAYETGFSFNIANRYINDFRVYDHCLSPKEVKEVSKGLILHYPLNNNGFGCKNYIKDSYYIKPTICAWGDSTYARTQVEINDDYFKGKFWKFTRGASGDGDFRIGWGESRITIDPSLYNDKNLCFSIWVKSTTGTTLYMYSARMSDQDYVGLGSTTIPANKWTKVVFNRVFLSSSSVADVNELELYFHITYNTDLIVAQAKLEISDEPTLWCPNQADILYSQLGLGSNIEYDVSGYENNGTKIGTLDYESNTPRYSCSSYLNGTDAYIQIPKMTLDFNSVTFSAWYKPSGNVEWGRIFDFGVGINGSGTTFLIDQNQKEMTLCIQGIYPDGTNIHSPDDVFYPIVANTWYHVACSVEGTICKWYIDGKLVMTKILTQNIGVVTFVNNYLAKSNWTDNPLNRCNICDFRIYATCLSDADVQELYNKPISIDNNGNLFAQEIIEEVDSVSKFNKTGIVENESIGNNPIIQDMKIKTLNDGSMWARILHHNNKSGTILFTPSNVMDIQTEDLYSRLYMLESFRDSDGSFEFMAIQPNMSENIIYRWKQNNNPTKSGSISGYVDIQNGQGGLVYGPDDKTLMSVGGVSNNWYSAVGCYNSWKSGIPGFVIKGGANTGVLDFYVRIDTLSKSNKFKIYNKHIQCNDIIEY